MIKSRAYELQFSKQAKKDIDLLPQKLKQKLYEILTEVISLNPYEGKKLLGELKSYYSYRLSYKDRIVYLINETQKIVYILRARTHYGE